MSRTGWFVVAGLALALILAVFISPFASSDPDGLEKVAHDKGFIEKAEQMPVSYNLESPLPDYSVPGVENEGLSTALAGGIGVAAVFAVSFSIAFILKKRKA